MGILEHSNDDDNYMPKTIGELADFLYENRETISDALQSNSLDGLSDALQSCLGIEYGEESLPRIGDDLQTLSDRIRQGSHKLESYPEQLKTMALGP